MHKRHGRIGGIAALGVLTLLGFSVRPAQAQTRRVLVGRSLLGIRLMDSKYADVLKKYGQPVEIQAGSPRLSEEMAGKKDDANNGGNPGGAPGGSPGGSPGGAPPEGGLPGFGGGRPGGPPPSSGGGGGFGGGSPGGSPSATANNGDDVKYKELGETTWWYRIVRKGKPTIHYSFLFNKDGRVIQIQEYGFSEGGKTVAGVGLGDSLGRVLSTYGWSNDGDRTPDDKLTMRYGTSEKLVFQIVKNQIVGITLAVVK